MQRSCLGTAFPACRTEAAHSRLGEQLILLWGSRHRGARGHYPAKHFMTIWG